MIEVQYSIEDAVYELLKAWNPDFIDTLKFEYTCGRMCELPNIWPWFQNCKTKLHSPCVQSLFPPSTIWVWDSAGCGVVGVAAAVFVFFI